MKYRLQKSNVFNAIIALVVTLCTADLQAQTPIWWGNYDNTAALSQFGAEAVDTYHCAVLANVARPELKGATLHGVRFYLADKSHVDDVCVWLSKSRPAAGDKADQLVVKVPKEALADLRNDQRMVEVMLPEAYPLQTNVYVGYSFRITQLTTDDDRRPIVVSKGQRTTGSLWMRTAKTIPAWSDYTNLQGALTIQMMITNPNLPDHDVRAGAQEPMVAQIASNAPATLSLTHRGLAPLVSVDYVTTVDGHTQHETHYEFPQPVSTYGTSVTMPATLPVPAVNGTYDYSIRVTRVNGQPNAAEADATGSGTLIATDRLGTRRTVMEEYTGTWCGWCPRGIVALSDLATSFGDRFIGIAAHNKDAMAISAYQSLMTGSFPAASIDRSVNCDPYHGTTDELTDYAAPAVVTAALERPTEADLALTAQWSDESRTQIVCNAATTFYYDCPNAPYALAFVLTADGLTGSGKAWDQVNYFSGQKGYPENLAEFCQADDPVTGMIYDHVAVAALGIASGIKGSISSPLVSGAQQVYTTTITTEGNTIIQDRNRLHAVALLINTSTGRIANAALSEIHPAGYNAVNNLHTAARHTATFDLSGRRIERPVKGIYIQGGKKIIK